MKYAIAFGNLIDGHVMYGPFETPQAARWWAALNKEDGNDMLIQLLDPESVSA